MTTFALTHGNPVPDVHLKTYGAGTVAVIDSMGGLIPCVVKRVVEAGRGQYATEGKVEVQVTRAAAGYRKGELVERPASKVVPVAHVIRRGYAYRINVLYRWA